MTAVAEATPTATATTSGTSAVASPIGVTNKANVVSVFVGDLDPTVGEDQLLDAFRSAGPIISVRVCRDIITRKSLGYGYVNFQNHADAERTIGSMNFTQIGGRRVRLMWQQRDPALRISGQGNLFVRGLEPTTDHKKLVDLFTPHGAIMSAKVMTDGEGKCRGYGFVHFKDEASASTALEKMNGKQVEGWTNPLYVANFLRRNARIALLVQNFTNVYIKHLLPQVSESDIKSFFSKFGGITSTCAKADQKGRVFAFCNFSKHDDAVKAIEACHESEVDGMSEGAETLYVTRAQHRAERLIELRQKYLQRQSRGNNLYVRNFDPEFTDENLKELFQGFGDIKSCKVMFDEKQNPRGFGFVSFTSAEEANLALREMNGRMLNGKPLVVNIAQRRDHRMSMLQVQFHQRLQNMIQPIAPMFYAAHKGFLQQQQTTTTGTSGAAAQQQVPPQGATPMSNAQMMGMAMNMFSGMAQQPWNEGGGGRGPSRTMAGGGGKQQGGGGGKRRGQRQQQQHRDVNVGTSGAAQQQPQAAAATATTAAAPAGVMSLKELMAMPVDERKRTLGEKLFPLVLAADVPEELTPKITGMLLELEPADGLALLSDAKKLKDKIDEALCVLKASA